MSNESDLPSGPAVAVGPATSARTQLALFGPMRSPVGVSIAGKVAEAITLLLLVSVVPRQLGPARYGVFSLALAIVTIGSSSFALGGPSLMSRFIPVAAPEERAALARALAVRALRWRILQLAGFVVVVAILATVDPGRFPPLESSLVVVALGLDVVATLAFQIGLGLGRTTAWSFRYPAQQGALVVAAVLLAGAGSAGAVSAIAVAAGLALLLGLPGLAPLRGAPDAGLPPGATRFALVNGATGLMVQFIHRAGVVAVVLVAGSNVQAGYAALAAGVGLAGTYLVWQVFTVELPRLAMMASDDPDGVTRATSRLAERLLVVLVPAAIVAVPIAEHAIPLVAGDRFRDALPALGPAIALVPVAPLTAVGNQAAALRLRLGARLTSGIAGALVFVAVAGALVPDHGALGATIALLAGSVAMTAGMAVAFADVVTSRLLLEAAAGVAGVLVLAALT